MKLELKANLLDIGTGGPLVVLLDDDTAKELNVFIGDRVKVSSNSRFTICTVDLAQNEPRDTIGIFRETAKVLKIKDGQIVRVSPVSRPESIRYIRRKLDGKILKPEQIRRIIKDIASNHLTNEEVAYFVSAIYVHGFSMRETYSATKAMVDTGSRLMWRRGAVSKHCIGGVSGNRTTMLVVPIVASAGLLMPKTSSRAITSPAGTADTMEVLAPVNISDIGKIRDVVLNAGGCIIWGGALDLAPADDKIIRAEHPLNLDPAPMLLASILAKKKSEGASKVLIDIPVGKYSKIKTGRSFNKLKRNFLKLGKLLDMKVCVVKSQGVAPVGKGIGPALEARDVLWTLLRDHRAPKDLENKAVYMAAILLKLGGKVKTEIGGRRLARKLLESGKAYEQMKKIIKAQGGNPERNPNKIELSKLTYTFEIKKKGRIVGIHDDLVAEIAKIAGAPKDKGAGIYLHKQVGDKVIRGDAVFTIYSNSKYRLEQAKKLASKVVRFK